MTVKSYYDGQDYEACKKMSFKLKKAEIYSKFEGLKSVEHLCERWPSFCNDLSAQCTTVKCNRRLLSCDRRKLEG